MQIPLLHQQILLSTERLRDLHRMLMNHPSSIPSSELDSLLQEIRQLYSLTLDLQRENSMNLLNEASALFQNSKEAAASIPPPEKPVVIHEPVAEVIKPHIDSVNEIKTTEKKKILSDMHSMFPEKTIVAGRYAEHETLGERIAHVEHKKTFSENLKVPVKELKSAIGLNEKFQFINQLFGGDSKKYNDTISALDKLNSSEAAMNHLHNISEEHNWEDHAASAKSFFDLLARKFSA